MNLTALNRLTEDDEGRSPHLYLCSRGHVTVGVGHMIPSAAAALKLDMEPRARIAQDYAAVSAAPVGMIAMAYAKYSTSRMPNAAINALLDADTAAFVAQLRSHLPAFTTWPDPAQEAIFNMAYNLGMAGLLKYTHLVAALSRRDWPTCAAECHRNGISEARNKRTAALFVKA